MLNIELCWTLYKWKLLQQQKSLLQMQVSHLPVTSVPSLHNDEWFWHSLPLPSESSQSRVRDLDNSLMQGKQHIISEMKWKPLFKWQHTCLWAFFYYNTSLHYFVITYFPSLLCCLLDWELLKGMGPVGLIVISPTASTETDTKWVRSTHLFNEWLENWMNE